MKYILLFSLGLFGCTWVYEVPEPRQASDSMTCHEYKTPIHSEGRRNATVRRCHDPVLNMDYDTVLSSD